MRIIHFSFSFSYHFIVKITLKPNQKEIKTCGKTKKELALLKNMINVDDRIQLTIDFRLP